MTDYADRLAEMQDAYDGAEAKSSGGSIPDGDYEGQVERFDFWEKDGGGPLKLITEISVLGGEFDGRSAPSVWHELEDPDRIGWTKGYLEMLGLQGVSLAGLPAALEPLCGEARVEIRIVTTEKNGKTYRNTYVNELLGEAPERPAPKESNDAGAVEAKTETEDDLPFARPEYREPFSERERRSNRGSYRTP